MENSLLVDWRKCTGCRICEISCSLVHENVCNPFLSRIRVIADEKRLFYFPASCAGCNDPVCVEVCPVQALSVEADTGAVVVNEERCIGCKECALHCPFGAANIHPITKKAFKCDLCDGDPVCAKRCPTGAITYGPLDVRVRKTRRKRGEETHRILEEKGQEQGPAPQHQA